VVRSFLIGAGALVLTGCAATPIGMGVKVAGQVVSDVDIKERGKQLLGQPPAAADNMFGMPEDVLESLFDSRTWRIYNNASDPLGLSRYIVEVANNQIIGVTKAQRYSEAAMDAARQLAAEGQVMGATPAQAEARLKMGPPKYTLRSTTTGQLIQLFDASLINIPGITNPEFCVVRYGPDQRVARVDLTTATASAGVKP
jgi:hypothetical protein